MSFDWRWKHWIMLGLGAIGASVYFGLITGARLETMLERLAAQSESTAAVFAQDAGRGEALVIVFGFLLLTPVAFAMAAFVPLFASAVVAEFLFSLARLPHVAGTLLFWVTVTAVAWVRADGWLPSVQWLGSLIARAFLIALRTR